MRCFFAPSRLLTIQICAFALVLASLAPRGRADVPPLEPRRAWILARDQARQSHDAPGVAEAHARLAADAVARARAAHDAWMTRRNADTGLFPQAPDKPEFNYHNVAADFLCFQFAIAEFTESPSLVAIKDTLARERALNLKAPDGLVGRFNVATAAPIETSAWDRLFGACEYLKDGLIGLYERTGDPDVKSRMIELVDAIDRASVVESKFGRVPSRNSEINGNVLQTFARLATTIEGQRADRCAAMVGRLGDAMIRQMLPASNGVPVMVFDFAGDGARIATDPRHTAVQLRDHGNETAVGLSEAFALAVAHAPKEKDWADRADAWAEPLARMYETILKKGVNDSGLLVNRMQADTLTITDMRPCDTWGYLIVGAITFVESARKHGALDRARLDTILARADAIARAVAKTDALKWQVVRGVEQHDGWADTIESAIYVAHARPGLRQLLLDWCDHQIAYMFAMQKPDGFVAGDYLDGNFIRTAMLYAEARSGAARLRPWSTQAAAGWSQDDGGGEATFVVISTGLKYQGEMTFDTPRHHQRLGLPWNWPRLNSWPEWFTAASGVTRPVQVDPGTRTPVAPPPPDR